jgi:acetamidase/formamidase
MATVSDCRVSQVVNVKKGIHCLNPEKCARQGRHGAARPRRPSKYYVSHVKDADLNKAMNDASMGMIKLLETEKKIARLDAYGLASVAMDCRVGAVSDTEKNVHCLMPKSIWVKHRQALTEEHGQGHPRGPASFQNRWRCVRSHRRLASRWRNRPDWRRTASRSSPPRPICAA